MRLKSWNWKLFFGKFEEFSWLEIRMIDFFLQKLAIVQILTFIFQISYETKSSRDILKSMNMRFDLNGYSSFLSFNFLFVFVFWSFKAAKTLISISLLPWVKNK